MVDRDADEGGVADAVTDVVVDSEFGGVIHEHDPRFGMVLAVAHGDVRGVCAPRHLPDQVLLSVQGAVVELVEHVCDVLAGKHRRRCG